MLVCASRARRCRRAWSWARRARRGVMEGSFLAPDLAISWAAPAASASGTARFQRDATRLTVRAPTVDLSAALLLRPPPLDALRRVTTQARSASRFPIIEKKSMAVKSH